MNVDGTATLLAAAREAGVRRAVLDLVDRGLRRAEGAPDRRGRRRSSASAHYGESKIEAEERRARRRPPRARGRDRAPEDVHRPRAARRLRDPVRLDPRGPPDLRSSATARTATSCSRSRISSTRSCARPSAPTSPARPSTSARPSSAPCAPTSRRLIAHAGSAQPPAPGARRGRPSSRCARSSCARALAARGVALQDRAPRLVRRDVAKAQRLLGWAPRLSNERRSAETYDWYLANRGRLRAAGRHAPRAVEPARAGLLKRLS